MHCHVLVTYLQQLEKQDQCFCGPCVSSVQPLRMDSTAKASDILSKTILTVQPSRASARLRRPFAPVDDTLREHATVRLRVVTLRRKTTHSKHAARQYLHAAAGSRRPGAVLRDICAGFLCALRLQGGLLLAQLLRQALLLLPELLDLHQNLSI